MKRTFREWKKLTHNFKFARLAFTSRLTAFKVKHTLIHCFTTLLHNCRELRAQRMWTGFISLMRQSRVFDFWRRLYQRRMSEKYKVTCSMLGIYKTQKFHMFRIWKLKTQQGYRLNQMRLRAYAWRRWRAVFAANNHLRMYQKKHAFNVLKLHFFSPDIRKRLIMKRRRKVGALVHR